MEPNRTQSSDWVRLGSITERSISYAGSNKYLHMSSVQQQPQNFPPATPNPPTTEKISYLRENSINLALLAAFILEDAFKINEAERQTYGKFAYAIKRLKQNSLIC